MRKPRARVHGKGPSTPSPRLSRRWRAQKSTGPSRPNRDVLRLVTMSSGSRQYPSVILRCSSCNFHRSVCIEEFTYGADGSIPQQMMSTEGPTAVDTLNPYERTEAETMAWESGVETEVCSEGGMNVSFIENGDSIKVKEVDFGAGAISFEASVASETNGGSIELHLDSPSGELV